MNSWISVIFRLISQSWKQVIPWRDRVTGKVPPPPPTFPSACIPNSTFSSFLFTFSCECCTWVCMDDVYTRVWIHVHVHVHPCGGLRLMSENHSWCLIHLVHRGRVSHINPELAKMASLLPLPNFPDRNYSLAAMLTWQFVGFWESKLWSSYLCSRHFCR